MRSRPAALSITVRDDGSFRVDPDPDAAAGYRVRFTGRLPESTQAWRTRCGLAHQGQTVPFSVTTCWVPVLATSAQVAPLLRPLRWPENMAGIDVQPLGPPEIDTPRRWRGRVRETLDFGASSLSCDLDMRFTQGARAVAIPYRLAGPSDVLLRNEGDVRARECDDPLLGRVTEVRVLKELHIRPEADAAMLGGLAPPLAKLYLEWMLTQFSWNVSTRRPWEDVPVVDEVALGRLEEHLAGLIDA